MGGNNAPTVSSRISERIISKYQRISEPTQIISASPDTREISLHGGVSDAQTGGSNIKLVNQIAISSQPF